MNGNGRGRPKANPRERRSVKMDFRVTEDEREEIKSYAKRHGLSMSQVVQKGVHLLLRSEG